MFFSCQFRTGQVAVEEGEPLVVVAVVVAVALLPSREMNVKNQSRKSIT